MADYTKPLPAVSSLNRPYWEGLTQRRLVMPQCDECGKFWYPPTPFCPECWSRDFTWQQLSGRGRVNSWVVFHQAYFRRSRTIFRIMLPRSNWKRDRVC